MERPRRSPAPGSWSQAFAPVQWTRPTAKGLVWGISHCRRSAGSDGWSSTELAFFPPQAIQMWFSIFEIWLQKRALPLQLSETRFVNVSKPNKQLETFCPWRLVCIAWLGVLTSCGLRNPRCQQDGFVAPLDRGFGHGLTGGLLRTSASGPVPRDGSLGKLTLASSIEQPVFALVSPQGCPIAPSHDASGSDGLCFRHTKAFAEGWRQSFQVLHGRQVVLGQMMVRHPKQNRHCDFGSPRA